jgi:hypothetical protein
LVGLAVLGLPAVLPVFDKGLFDAFTCFEDLVLVVPTAWNVSYSIPSMYSMPSMDMDPSRIPKSSADNIDRLLALVTAATIKAMVTTMSLMM